MKTADLEVGRAYRATAGYPFYGGRLVVLETGVPYAYRYYSVRPKATKGIRVRVESSRYREDIGKEKTVRPAVIMRPWTDADNLELAAAVAHRAQVDALRERVRPIDGVREQGGGLYIEPQLVPVILEAMGW